MKYIVKKIIVAAFVSLITPSYAADNAATNTNTMSSAEKVQIEEIVHQYLLRKPEVIMEAIQILQRKQFEEAQQTVKVTQKTASQFANALFHSANDPVLGNPNGTITVVEFFDYQCPHCVQMAPIMSDIIKANPSLRVILKEFPIRGPMSLLAARAALAANMQGKYSDLSHAMLMTKEPLTEDNIYQMAKSNGLNLDQLKKDMNNASIENQIKANIKLAQDLKLFGTPAFFVGKTNAKGNIEYIPGRVDQKQLQSIIDKVK